MAELIKRNEGAAAPAVLSSQVGALAPLLVSTLPSVPTAVNAVASVADW